MNAAPAAPAGIDLSSDLRGTVTAALTHIKAQIAVVDARVVELRGSGGAGFDAELASAGAKLARALKELSGELRQLERHDGRMTLTPEQRFAELLKYVRTLPDLQLGMLADVVDGLQGKAA